MFFPSFSPTTLTVKHAFEKSFRRLLAGRNLPVDVYEMLFSLPTSKTAGIFLRRQQGSSSRERCVAGVLRRFKVFSPFFFFLVGGFSFTPNTHSYCSQIKQNHTIIVGSSKLLLIQIIVIYRQTTQSRFLVWHMSSVVSRAMNK